MYVFKEISRPQLEVLILLNIVDRIINAVARCERTMRGAESGVIDPEGEIKQFLALFSEQYIE